MADSQPGYKGSAADVTRQSRGNVQMRGGAAGDFGAEDWTEILARYKNTCAYCRITLLFNVAAKHPQKATIDHVMPISMGGLHTKSNVVPACWRCNSRKGETYLQPLPPPGQPRESTHEPITPPAVRARKKLVVRPAHVAAIIALRAQGRTIKQIMLATGLTFNQVVRQLTTLQSEGRVPVIARGRRRKALPVPIDQADQAS